MHRNRRQSIDNTLSVPDIREDTIMSGCVLEPEWVVGTCNNSNAPM